LGRQKALEINTLHHDDNAVTGIIARRASTGAVVEYRGRARIGLAVG